MRSARLTIAIAFLALPGLAAAPLSHADGWADLHWGMDQEKILKVYPTARFTPGKDPGTTEVDFGDLEVFGGKYAVRAMIVGGSGLGVIRISTLGRKEMPKRDEVVSMVGNLRNELTQRYGSATSKDANSMTWKLERTHIVLGWSMDAGILMLTYKNPAISAPKP